jgi:hypothetical protein
MARFGSRDIGLAALAAPVAQTEHRYGHLPSRRSSGAHHPRSRRRGSRRRGRIDASNRTAILELDPDGEIVPIDIDSDIHVLQKQIWTGRVVKAPDFATGQDQPPNGLGIAPPAFKPIPKGDAQSSSSSFRFKPLSPIASREI